MEARVGFEPTIMDLQSTALDQLCYPAAGSNYMQYLNSQGNSYMFICLYCGKIV